jgi:cullin-associated NEDD8-dissociated protein 1
LLSFDPNYTYPQDDDDEKLGFEEDEGEGWGSDFEDENMGNEDDDDSSWKVRRASAKLIDGIFSARPDMLRDLYRKYGELLSSRFKERDVNVKCNILDTFHTVLKSAIHSEQNQGLDFELSQTPSLARAKSSADELHNFIPQIINRIVK